MPVGVLGRPEWRCRGGVLVGGCGGEGGERQQSDGGSGGRGMRRQRSEELDRLPESVVGSEGRSVRRFRASRPNQLAAIEQERVSGRPRPTKQEPGA